MESNTKIAAAIVAAQADIKAAGKSGDNKFDKYTYAKLEDFFAAAKPIMAKHGLALLMSVESCETLEDRTTKNGGKEHAVRVRLVGNLIHTSGESLTVTGYGEGQDRADKALYKAITGGKKYLVASLFSIPTTDDPEADETVGTTAAPPAPPARPKVASKTGEVLKKKPEWSQEQKDEVAGLITSIYAYPNGEKIVSDIRSRMAYDAPADVIDEMGGVLLQLNNDAAEIAAQDMTK